MSQSDPHAAARPAPVQPSSPTGSQPSRLHGLHRIRHRGQVPPGGTSGSRRYLGWIPIAGVEIAAVISLRNLPTMSAMGWQMIFYYALSIVVFMLPCAYVAGELASA